MMQAANSVEFDPIRHSTSASLDRLSRLGDHVALGEPGRRHGRRRLAAEAWPRTDMRLHSARMR